MGIQERKKIEKAQRRQKILVAAKKVTGLKGFNSTTMEDIAQEAELSQATIYLYFNNKEELFISLTLHSLQYLDLRLGEVSANYGKTDINTKISALYDVLRDAYEFEPLILENMFHLLAAGNLESLTPALQMQLKSLFNSMIENLTGIFSDNNKDTGTVLMADNAANIFFALLSGISIWSGISSQLFENKIIGNYSENCGSTVDLFHCAVNFLQAGITTYPIYPMPN
jgi:AcrR family transcriptional regulator